MAAVPNSILDETKKTLGLDADYTAFDPDVKMLINAAFATLHDLGVGPTDAYSIKDSDNLWGEFFGLRADNNDVKAYIAYKVRIIFDPPQTSFVLTAYQDMIKETEWRLNARNDSYESPYSADNPPSGFWWEISDADGFPPEANIGDLGFDPITGTVWRNV